MFWISLPLLLAFSRWLFCLRLLLRWLLCWRCLLCGLFRLCLFYRRGLLRCCAPGVLQPVQLVQKLRYLGSQVAGGETAVHDGFNAFFNRFFHADDVSDHVTVNLYIRHVYYLSPLCF